MGGNALTYASVRLTRANYQRLAADCLAKLQARFPGRRLAVLEAYRTKADFGDCDILVEGGDGYDPHHAATALGAVEVVRNGPVTSVGVLVRPDVPHCDGNVFQVDLVSIPAPAFDYAAHYFSFNDLGNLIGRTAHKMGLSHRHDGLWFPVRDGDYKFRDILLTQDYAAALHFLGYDAGRFQAGFEQLTDIFAYVTASHYFNRDIFLLENRNAASRLRDRKRPTYTAFLAHCAAHPDLPSFAYPEHKADWLPRIAEHFPHFAGEHAQALADIARLRAVKAKFNGHWVSELTGLQGKELGALMQQVKESFPGADALHTFVLESPPTVLEAWVRALQAELPGAHNASCRAC